MRIETQSSYLPEGFLVSAVHAGIKKEKKDLAIIFSKTPAVTAGVFTQNKIKAAPVLLCKKVLSKSHFISSVIINSGNANAFTGEQGDKDAYKMALETSKSLSIPIEQVLVSSTGVIGEHLPMLKILNSISLAAKSLSSDRIDDVAKAIMTTDLVPKKASVCLTLDDETKINLFCVAKGSGMISPNMATTLSFVMTDAKVSKQALQKLLAQATKRSFNRISVDGDQSTNDMILMLANGFAGNKVITEESPNYSVLYEALEKLLIAAAKMVARDGEGATKLIQVKVSGAKTESEAEQACRNIANSNLVKTAMYGEDPNWGRVVCALGYSGIDFKPEKIEVSFNDYQVLKKNYEINFNEKQMKSILKTDNVCIDVKLNQGQEEAVFWTCDFSENYVFINARYRT